MTQKKVKDIPKQHFELFDLGPNNRLNACVGKNGGPYNFIDYARGYFMAGWRLVQSLKDDQSNIDLMAYPLIFIYRQGTELALKHLARYMPYLEGEKEDMKLTHDLMKNWDLVKTRLSHFSEFDNKKTIPFVDHIINKLVYMDSKGDVFRYPESKNKKLNLDYFGHINIERVGLLMNKAAEIFDFWTYTMADLFDRRQEGEGNNSNQQTCPTIHSSGRATRRPAAEF